MTLKPGVIDIYDFDKTIYDGDSSLDFFWFSLCKKPSLVIYLPYQIWHAILFMIGLERRTNFKSHFFIFLHRIEAEKFADDFWQSHYKKIKSWYLGQDHSNDAIISASPEFLLKPVSIKLKVYALIATRINPKTGRIDGENCRGEEKVIRLNKDLHGLTIRRVYTDHASDAPLLALAKEKYFVKGTKVTKLN